MSDTLTNAFVVWLAMGDAIAVNMSFRLTTNIWYIILHGWLGWVYVIYRAAVLHSF